MKSTTNPFETILQPFRDLDIASTYQQFSVFIDFIIYLTIFTALSRFVFTKRFPGREGKTISIGIAFTLSIAMTVFSYTTGFKLGNLAPLAAVILLAIVAVGIFVFTKHLGGNSANASIVAFIISYLLTRATFPEVYQWAEQNQFAAWIDAAALLSIPILLAMLVLRFKSSLSSKGIIPNIDFGRDKAMKDTEREEVTNLENKEKFARGLSNAENQAAKSEKAIGRDLKAIIEILSRKGITPETIPTIRELLTDMQRQNGELNKAQDQLRLINQRLEEWDISSFRKLSETFRRLSPKKQRLLKTAIETERQSITSNEALETIERGIEQRHQEFVKYLNAAIKEVEENNARQAINYLTQALKNEVSLKKLLDQFRRVEKQLLRLTRGEVDIVKRLAA